MARYRLGDVAPIQQGVVPYSNQYWLLNLDMVESNTGKVLDYLFVDDSQIGASTVSFDQSNVLYSKLRPYLNKVVLPDRAGYATSEMLPLKPDEKIIIRDYLAYFLRSPHFVNYINEKTSGAKMPRANTADLKAYEIDCPSIVKQKRIVSQIDSISRIIQARQQQLTSLDDLIKARFVEMFGLPGTDVKGWGLTPLGNCCELNPKKGKDDRLVDGLEISFVPMPAVSENGAINASETKLYEEVKSGFTYFIENDVLFAKITPCMENGKGAVAVGLHNEIGFGSTEFHVLRPLLGMSDPFWIYSLTSFESFRKDAAANMTGSAGQRRVPASFLERYKVALPPLELQKQFADFTLQVDKSKVVEKMTS